MPRSPDDRDAELLSALDRAIEALHAARVIATGGVPDSEVPPMADDLLDAALRADDNYAAARMAVRERLDALQRAVDDPAWRKECLAAEAALTAREVAATEVCWKLGWTTASRTGRER